LGTLAQREGDRRALSHPGTGRAGPGWHQKARFYQALAALGVTERERSKLAELYAPGQALWRAPIAHFSSADLNWPVQTTCDSVDFSVEVDQPCKGPCVAPGSEIDVQDQVLRETLPVSGTLRPIWWWRAFSSWSAM